jgi:protein ImuB
MFACIFERESSSIQHDGGYPEPAQNRLVDIAYSFSPLIEETHPDTVTLNLRGLEQLFGSFRNIAEQILKRGCQLGLAVNVAIAKDPDVAIHIARNSEGVSIIEQLDEARSISAFDLCSIDYTLAGVEAEKATEIVQTLNLWGIKTFGEFAALPENGVAERLGQDGLRLQRLARGKSKRKLRIRTTAPLFQHSIELEHHIKEIEPLSFLLSGLLNRICAALYGAALATSELHLFLTRVDGIEDKRSISLPSPSRDSRTFLKLLKLHIEANPPEAAIKQITLKCDPVKPRVQQTGLFQPLSPEPDKLELTLARIAKLVGPGNLGSPELLDTHRPDGVLMKRFTSSGRIAKRRKRPGRYQQLAGFRRFRPALAAKVNEIGGRPVRVSARDKGQSVRGTVVRLAGPWRTTGNWWAESNWARDEWDVTISDGADREAVFRIFRELHSGEWYVEGSYD